MTPDQANRTCYACKKLFCCAQCRERHEVNKHTKRQPNCPFCMNQQFPLKPIEDKTLLCHIAVTHLPLHCHLCGEIFKHTKELESFGTCKWWKSRHTLISGKKPVLGTPPLIFEGKESSEHNGKFGSLTSPPELYRNTSTPMVLGQKTSFDFKTPNSSNFSLKTPKNSSASLKTDQIHNGLQGSSSNCDDSSNYVSFPSANTDKETPFRLLPSSRGNLEDPARNRSTKMNTIQDKDKSTQSEFYADNICVEDMELTNIDNAVLPDSQSLEVCQAKMRSDSLKKVRFSDQQINPSGPSSTTTFNTTENEEYFVACDTMSETKQSLEKSEVKFYEDNEKNTEKENRSPNKANANGTQKSSCSSRVVMTVVVENNSSIPTADIIESSLKKLGRVASSTDLLSRIDNKSPGCSSSVSSADSYYTFVNHKYHSPLNDFKVSFSNSKDNNYSGGILSTIANAVKSLMIKFSGSSKNTERKEDFTRQDFPRPSTSETLNSVDFEPLLQTSGKRRRDIIESAISAQRQPEILDSQIEVRSPLAKRHCGWFYNARAREPIARMRKNRQLTSSRGVSSETQVFHQGSLSVGDTVLPLPDRAHQSTQTD